MTVTDTRNPRKRACIRAPRDPDTPVRSKRTHVAPQPKLSHIFYFQKLFLWKLTRKVSWSLQAEIILRDVWGFLFVLFLCERKVAI